MALGAGGNRAVFLTHRAVGAFAVGMQRLWLIWAIPRTVACLTSSSSLGMAPVGQTWPHRVQLGIAIAQARTSPGRQSLRRRLRRPRDAGRCWGRPSCTRRSGCSGTETHLHPGPPAGGSGIRAGLPGQGAPAQQGHQGHAGPQRGESPGVCPGPGVSGGFSGQI